MLKWMLLTVAVGAEVFATLCLKYSDGFTKPWPVVGLGAGFLTVNPGSIGTIAAATINWSSSGLILNNGVALTLGGDRQVTIVPGGSVGSGTDVIIDVTGYFL